MASAISQRPNPPSANDPSHDVQHQSSFSSFSHSRTSSSHSSSMIHQSGTSQPQPARESGSSISSANLSKLSSSPGVGSTRQYNHSTPRYFPGRKLKSQYPANSKKKHVEYILVASFDVDRGSVIECQYPRPSSGNEHKLAELMLPDQSHVRSQDWTVFFLPATGRDNDKEAAEEMDKGYKHVKDTEWSGDGEHANEDKINTNDESYDDSDHDGYNEEDSNMMYVLNLVNTKQDNTLKRGAVVKAMAICTRHSFLHIYKPLLLLALEEYFRAPHSETLESLYNAVNSMDLSMMPKLSSLERQILQASIAKDMFIEKFEQMVQQRMVDAAAAQRASSEQCSPDQSPDTSVQQQRYVLPRDTHEFESRVLYNGIPVPIKVPTATFPETVGDFSLIKLITTFSTPHGTSPQPFALHPHLTTSGAYTHPIIVLVNALLTQKRVIFLGHNCPSGEVSEAVLAACALASGGILRGFTRHAFPYTDLSKIDDFLNVPGFVAGVNNPAFAHKPEWWDLLCDLPSGRMRISTHISPAVTSEAIASFQQEQIAKMGIGIANGHGYSTSANGTQSHVSNGSNTSGANSGNGSIGGGSTIADPTGDSSFMENLVQSISSRHGEAAIRSKWRSWVLRFTRISAALEEAVYDASALYIGAHEADTDAAAFGVSGHGCVWPDEVARARELSANIYRIDGWKNTRSYNGYIHDLIKVWNRCPVRSLDFMHQHDQLRFLRLGHEASARIYLAFWKAVDPAAMAGRSLHYEETDGGSGMGSGSRSSSSMENTDRSQLLYGTVSQLLTVVPESNSGLFYIALGLFHPWQEVRSAVVRLLEKIIEHPAGRHFWASVGRFSQMAFYRLKREEKIMGLRI